ncbi:hypothetical protein, partial [Chitinophaga sp.]|uniref:hypothetical protein n=1 Tax=Chitinophaga sp. TaxID=1869181 RepID=UPI002F925099
MGQDTRQIQGSNDNELSLRDIIITFNKGIRHLLGKWVIILICGVSGAAVGLVASLLLKKKYIAELTFVLEDSKTNPLGSLMGLASDFGLDGGGASSGIFSGDNILQFLQSRLMIEKALLSVVNVGNKQQTLADLYIQVYDMNKGMKDISSLNGFYYPVNLPRNKFTRQQDSILNILQAKIVTNNLTVEKPDKKLSFISVKCASLNEIFSKSFTEQLVDLATDFYIDTKTKRNKENIDRLQVQADSIELMLNRKTYSAASVNDLNMNPARQVTRVSSELAERDKMVLQTMYAEVVKNLEMSKIAMAQEKPLIQIVDTPILPLEQKKMRKSLCIAVGGFIGGLLALIT